MPFEPTKLTFRNPFGKPSSNDQKQGQQQSQHDMMAEDGGTAPGAGSGTSPTTAQPSDRMMDNNSNNNSMKMDKNTPPSPRQHQHFPRSSIGSGGSGEQRGVRVATSPTTTMDPNSNILSSSPGGDVLMDDDSRVAGGPPMEKLDRRMSREWDASQVPPSQFQRRRGSIFATPNSRDGKVAGADRDKAYHDKLKEKGWQVPRKNSS